jgi:O-antigen ligase/tetratricopeptide (TPR) repeat protein
MKNAPNKQDRDKSKALVIFEYALLVFYLGVIILRVIYTEGPTMQTSNISITVSDSLYSLYISTALFFSFILWAVWKLSSRKYFYRSTGIEIGLAIFTIAAVISCSAASDKRLALNNIFSLFTPILCAILLVQIIDTSAKARLVFVVIAVLGVVSAYQCADQLLFLNRETVEQFEENPDSILEPLNIEQGSLQYFLLKQRLYADNARAYFTTRNSAGSFLLMAYFAAAALMIARLLKRKAGEKNHRKYYISDIIVIILIVSIFLTKSKGAIIGLFFAMSLFALYLKAGAWLKIHRKTVLAIFILIVTAGVLVIAWYGLTYNTLPGGNSMFVRWQYWHASAKMFTAHFWTGVGPGNFSIYYPRYKPAAALETVTDPHNFALNILTQYGPLGLIGFLIMIFLPLWKITGSDNRVSVRSDEEHKPVLNKTLVNFIFCAWFVVLLARLSIWPALKSPNFLVVIYVTIRYFFPPVAVFIASLLLLQRYTDPGINNKDSVQIRNTIVAIIFCMLLGVLLHNLTDYAIFEPGIYTTFWFLLATLIAINANNANQQKKIFFDTVTAKFPKIIVPFGAILMGIGVCFIFLNYVLLPVAQSTGKIELANKAFSYGRLEQAHDLLDSAAADDMLCTYALSLNAQMYMKNAEITASREEKFRLLLYAEKYVREAVSRNSASYKNYEDLSEVYQRLSEVSKPEETTDWLNLALGVATEAKNRYPGSGRLHFNLAQIADRLGKRDTAIEQYNKSIDIENQFRNQFHEMYPNEEIVSRLGEKKYQFAKERVSELENEEGA